MPLFAIDPSKCNGDGLCATVCPAGCIEFTKGTLPFPHEKKQAYCIRCGHCLAVCPTDAISLESFPSSVPRDRSLDISWEQAEQFLSGRRSVRFFKDAPVDETLLARLLAVTAYAPAGHNARNTKWSVASSREKVAELAKAIVNWMRGEAEKDSPVAAKLHLPGIVRAWEKGLDLVCRNAPALAVAYGPKKGVSPRENGILAVSYLDLAATAVGLGCCWCGYLMAAGVHDQTIRSILGIPEQEIVYGALMLGKPALRFRSIPPRREPDVQWLY